MDNQPRNFVLNFVKRITATYRNMFLSATILLLFTGCVGLLIDSMTKSDMVGPTFSELSEIDSQPQGNDARVYIYRTKESTKYSLQPGTGIMKSCLHFTIDENVYFLIWETFIRQDLTASDHEIALAYYEEEQEGGKKVFQKRGTRVQFSLQRNQVIFIRFDLVDDEYQPIIVEEYAAKSEISELPIQEKGTLVGRIGGRYGEIETTKHADGKMQNIPTSEGSANLQDSNRNSQTKVGENRKGYPNSEEILNINGVWNVKIENYGVLSRHGTWKFVAKITQNGTTFEAIRMNNYAFYQKGTVALSGEIDKNGFKNVVAHTNSQPIPMRGKIKDNGNRLIFDDGDMQRSTYTRSQ
jgi:hypothetical protein